MFTKNSKHKNLLIISFFFIFFILAIFIHDDYGVSFDELMHRINAKTSLGYISEFVDEFSISRFLNNDLPSLSWYYAKTGSEKLSELGAHNYGVFFDVFLEYLEGIINFNDQKDFLTFKHFLNFCVFFIASILFFDLVSMKFNDWRIGIFGCLLLILSPRFFAESFYNMKDLIFMSLFIISMNTSCKYIINPTLKNIFWASITIALMIDIRSIGIFLPALVILLTILKYFHKSISFRNLLTNSSILILLTSIFVILFWPRLWEAPYTNFVSSLSYFSAHAWNGHNFYLGKYIWAQNIPWHYLSVWIGITTPVLYLILFIFGIFLILRRLLNRLDKIDDNKKNYNDIWRGDKELLDLFFLGLFLGPFVLIITSGATLNDGWRQAYFLYPPLLMIALTGFYQINIILKKLKISKYFLFIVSLFLMSTFFWMIKAHPFQNVYFNFIAGKNPGEYFELDYWGLSDKEILERLLKKRPNDLIKIWPSSDTPLDNNMINYIIDKKDRDRIKIVKYIDESNYIINNNRYFGGEDGINEYNFDKSQYEIFDQMIVGNIIINTLYKNK